MRHLARLSALSAALIALLVPVSAATSAASVEKPVKPAKPDKAKDKPEKGRPGKDKAVDEADVSSEPALPLPDAPPPVPPAPTHPELTTLGETVAAAPSTGSIRVKLPGTAAFVDLPAGEALPVGSSVDATAGLVEIGSETASGGEQHAVVTGSVFRIDQDAAQGGVTDLTLQGGDFSGCDAPKRKGSARAAAAKKSTVVRGLWAAGKGRFRTRGRKSVASVRGTRWATVERCHSTTVRVFDGVVDVRDLITGKTVTLHAGERHVASTLGEQRA